ncbi:phosphoribosylanthranilate isomerase [Methylocystis parvus]|uniref:N-(5'-phosphoribosyl)anthranilate isomerase n=1 Tax=Methylocystis parvus TaxID=134 RepID=A0A6B8M2C6_9HYPH|nr:phosphoribosylanthranilate isomerase [Methylocystis parvus]QGM97001.1 phosphoribosylanthranilate isomerase [Methylocystis parvus]WBJ99104.1 phosphoribosylanthranilate isomerase [Methylocystis parvus OBBP]
MSTLVKICGLSAPKTLLAAIAAGAEMAGFVFFEKSPRHIDLETARTLGLLAQGRIARVALTVNASDAALDEIVDALAPEMLQLHGKESPARVAAVKARFGLPVIKAIGVAASEDIAASKAYEGLADMLLFDAKPAPDASVPGGAGISFDWDLLRNIGAKNWMLSGGLDRENVVEALRRTGAPAVDVSSGVERERGVKDAEKIKAFVEAVRSLS